MTLPDLIHHHYLYLGLPPWDTVSGGNLYNRDWVAALPASGQRVDLTAPDSIARAALSDHTRWLVVDSLWHHQFIQLAPERPKAMLLVHLLPEMTGDPRFGDAEPWPWLAAYEHFCVTGRYAYEYLCACGVAPQRITLIEPRLWPRDEGWPRDEARPGNHGRVGHGEAQARPLWLSINNLIPRKGILPALKAMQVLLQTNTAVPAFQWQVWGRHDLDSGYAEECHRLVASCPLLSHHVALVKGSSPEHAAAALLGADLFISAASMETYGMAVAEAATLGKPVVAIGNGNIPYLLDGGRGKHRVTQNHHQLMAAALSHDLEPAAPLELGHSRSSFRHAVHSFCQKVLR